jgi:hypothetical protein
MIKKLAAAAAFAVLCAASTPAAAVTLLTPNCNLLTGCTFSGNDNDVSATEAAYNLAHIEPPPPAILDLPNTFLAIQAVGSVMTMNWTSLTPISFISVKAGDNFNLFQLASPATSGTITSAGLTGPQGQQQAISHITLYGGTAVPEPATWAMMILGFAMVGAGLRLTRRSETPA